MLVETRQLLVIALLLVSGRQPAAAWVVRNAPDDCSRGETVTGSFQAVVLAPAGDKQQGAGSRQREAPAVCGSLTAPLPM